MIYWVVALIIDQGANMDWTLFWQIVMLMGWATVCYSIVQPTTKVKK